MSIVYMEQSAVTRSLSIWFFLLKVFSGEYPAHNNSHFPMPEYEHSTFVLITFLNILVIN